MYLFRDSLPRLDSNIRLFHAAAGAPPVDIYLNNTKIAENFSFSDLSNYLTVAPGKHKVTIYEAGSTNNSLYSEDLTILPASTDTVSIVLLESTLSLFTAKDATFLGESNLSFIRFINFSPNSPLLSLGLPNGDTLFNGAEYLETTGYFPLSAGIYDFEVFATDATSFKKFIKGINLSPGKYHTIYIIGLFDENPRVGSYITEDGTK